MTAEQEQVEALAERIRAVIDREVYCTVVIRPEHDPNCLGDCERNGCPIPVQDYGDTADLARAIASDAQVRAEAAAAVAARVEAVLTRALQRVRHDHAYPMEIGPHHCDGCDLEADIRAAQAGEER